MSASATPIPAQDHEPSHTSPITLNSEEPLLEGCWICMGNDPLFKVALRGAEATFMLGADDDLDTLENVDVEVRFPNGSRWSATVLSLAEIERIMDRWRLTGECLDGRFFQCPDLVIVRERGLDAIVALLNDLLDSNELQGTFVRLEDYE